MKADLAKRYPNSRRLGRHSTPVEVILRMLVVKRLYNWSYEQTEHFVSDSIVLRQFCRLYLESVPDDTTLIRWANQSVYKRVDVRVAILLVSGLGSPDYPPPWRPGPSSCPYSPQCVEGEFCELRLERRSGPRCFLHFGAAVRFAPLKCCAGLPPVRA